MEENYSWLESAKARVSEYQEHRTLEPVNKIQQDAMNLVMLSNPTAKYVSAYNFVQWDRCDPGFRVDLASRGVLDLISIPDIKRAIVGCYYPKMRVVPHALFSGNLLYLAKIASDYESFKKIVVLNPSGTEKNSFLKGDESTDFRDTIEVVNFSPNEVEMTVDVHAQKGSWFIYADAFHPNWKAFVDGAETPIYKAYLAFKSVFLKKGKHTVIFKYVGFGIFRSIILGIFGLMVGCILFFFFICEIIRYNKF